MSKENARRAAYAHSDLNTFGSIVTILEGGHLYMNRSEAAAKAIIAICKRQQQACLEIYDDAVTDSKGGKS